MTSLFYRLLTDETGQDLIEYAMLTGALALASVVAFAAISSAINAVYLTWDSSTQAIWEPQAPAGS